MKAKIKTLCALFIQFLKFGCFTFGGGLSIVAQMQQIYAHEQKLITDEELLDLTGVARSVPGMMVGNTALLFGYRQAGVLGGLVCLTGMVVPPMLIIAIITQVYSAFRDSFIVAAMMSGVRAAVVPIIFVSLLGLIKSAFRFPPCYGVAALDFVLFFFFDVSCIWLMLSGAVLGLVICSLYDREVQHR